MEVGDADREALVEQLVRHHIPVSDLARQPGEHGREHEPESRRPDLVAARGEEGLPQASPALASSACGCRRAFHVPSRPGSYRRGQTVAV